MKKFILGLFLVIFMASAFSFVGCRHSNHAYVIGPHKGHHKHHCRDKRRCLKIIKYHDYTDCDTVCSKREPDDD